MALALAQQIGTANHERTPTRQTQRNGYRARSWATRAGEIPQRISKSHQGKSRLSYPAQFPPAVALEAVATGATCCS
jgi:hypothetical protein